MRVKESRTRLSRARAIFLALYALLLGTYLYHGFQPYPVDASADIRLHIPEIHLSAPVNDVSKVDARIEVPEVIAGAYSENPYKTLLVGHSNTVFSRLGDLNIGDEITFDSQAYRITRIITEEKSQIDMSDILAPASTPTIILMTCTGAHIRGHDYTHRLIITATATD